MVSIEGSSEGLQILEKSASVLRQPFLVVRVVPSTCDGLLDTHAVRIFC